MDDLVCSTSFKFTVFMIGMFLRAILKKSLTIFYSCIENRKHYLLLTLSMNILRCKKVYFAFWCILYSALSVEGKTAILEKSAFGLLTSETEISNPPKSVALNGSNISSLVTRFVLWQNCEPVSDRKSGQKGKCCRGNYPCSHRYCRNTSACTMPFLRGLLWCFHDSCSSANEQPSSMPTSLSSSAPVTSTTSDDRASPVPTSPAPSILSSFSNSPMPTHPSTPAPSHSTKASTGPSSWCTGVRTRREIRDLSQGERLEWQQALLALRTEDSGGLNEWDSLVQAHIQNGDEAHGGAYFLPWHRLQLIQLENAIRRTRPNFALPYWDWTLDAANAASSPVWRPELAGGSRNGLPIADGAFANLSAIFPWEHVVIREFDSREMYSIPPLWARPDIDNLIHSQPWPAFADALEAAHALVHVSVGGDMRDTRTAPNDPVFWLLHVFVDSVFDERVQANGVNEFSGSHDFVDGTRAASEDHVLHPFQRSVYDALRLDCVQYVPSSLVGRSFRRNTGPVPSDACSRARFAANKKQAVSRCHRGFKILREQRSKL